MLSGANVDAAVIRVGPGPGTPAVGQVFDAGYCHCSRCRRTGGGGASISAIVEKDQFKLVSGTPSRYSGSAVGDDCFCATCGASLWFEERVGGYISVALGTLDDPERVRPAFHKNIESRLSWFEVADELPRYEGNTIPHPDRRQGSVRRMPSASEGE